METVFDLYFDDEGCGGRASHMCLMSCGQLQPKEHADDWAWIVDHTVQMGPEKCLVILGVRLHLLSTLARPLQHEDVEPIALLPMSVSTGERLLGFE